MSWLPSQWIAQENQWLDWSIAFSKKILDKKNKQAGNKEFVLPDTCVLFSAGNEGGMRLCSELRQLVP